jgi:hypothetical protein
MVWSKRYINITTIRFIYWRSLLPTRAITIKSTRQNPIETRYSLGEC